MPCFITSLGVLNALGTTKESVLTNMLACSQANLKESHWVPGATTYTAAVDKNLVLPSVPPELSVYESRNNQLALHALSEIRPDVDAAITKYGADRVAVVIGTSTSGIGEGEQATKDFEQTGNRPQSYCYQQQEIGNVAEFVAKFLGVYGPSSTVSTACSSSAHALGTAKRFIDAGLADAVIAGGVDSLCRLTVNGFAALESVSDTLTVPFSANRKGINIGEGAALFLIDSQAGVESIELMGVGASSDAHHISAPEPEGLGAEKAILSALRQANLKPQDITYINLHGTGTKLNDSMESKVISRVFGPEVKCSSSKGQIGHTLGAAAANEVALCWLSLSSLNSELGLPPHLWDSVPDTDLPKLNLVVGGSIGQMQCDVDHFHLSNSFAFGGNNAVVILGKRRAV